MKSFKQILEPANSASGLTLVETLVAISIIVMVVTVTTQTIQASFKDRRYAAKQSVATYLANDGIEQIRQLRDNNLIQITSTNIMDTDPTFNFWSGLPPENVIFTVNSDDVQVVSPCYGEGVETTEMSTEDCSILTTSAQGIPFTMQSATGQDTASGLPANSFRRYHIVQPESTATKKRILTAVEWEHNNRLNSFEIITELSNVNPPSSNPINN